jgi:hypothetical protein
VVALVLLGCGSPPAHDKGDLPESGQIEIACEMALLQLESLIERKSNEGGVSPAVLAEAREIFRLGRELYLEREYDLALEMVEEAIAMLKERDN